MLSFPVEKDSSAPSNTYQVNCTYGLFGGALAMISCATQEAAREMHRKFIGLDDLQSEIERSTNPELPILRV